MSKFKVGDRVRVHTGMYTGYTAGSRYNLPREDGFVTACGGDHEGFITVAFPGGMESPPVNPLSFELVAEPGPVRTVTTTRKEIVFGEFGIVKVNGKDTAMSDGTRRVPLSLAGPYPAATWADAAELRAAAATFIKLADALDEVA